MTNAAKVNPYSAEIEVSCALGHLVRGGTPKGARGCQGAMELPSIPTLLSVGTCWCSRGWAKRHITGVVPGST